MLVVEFSPSVFYDCAVSAPSACRPSRVYIQRSMARAVPTEPLKTSPALPTVSARAARLLLMEAQGLLDDSAARPTGTSLYKMIERMGFVQLDTISVVER